MTTYTITDTDGNTLATHEMHLRDQAQADALAEGWFNGCRPKGDTLLFRDGLLMAVSEGMTIRSYRAAPSMMRETAAA